jgi:hypothetical protein
MGIRVHGDKTPRAVKELRRHAPEFTICKSTRQLPKRCGNGGIGRRARLRAWWPQGRGGSSPLSRMFVSGPNGLLATQPDTVTHRDS